MKMSAESHPSSYSAARLAEQSRTLDTNVRAMIERCYLPPDAGAGDPSTWLSAIWERPATDPRHGRAAMIQARWNWILMHSSARQEERLARARYRGRLLTTPGAVLGALLLTSTYLSAKHRSQAPLWTANQIASFIHKQTGWSKTTVLTALDGLIGLGSIQSLEAADSSRRTLIYINDQGRRSGVCFIAIAEASRIAASIAAGDPVGELQARSWVTDLGHDRECIDQRVRCWDDYPEVDYPIVDYSKIGHSKSDSSPIALRCRQEKSKSDQANEIHI